MTYYDFLRRI